MAEGERQEGHPGRDGRRVQLAVHRRAPGHAGVHVGQLGCVDRLVMVGSWTCKHPPYLFDIS